VKLGVEIDAALVAGSLGLLALALRPLSPGVYAIRAKRTT
jgi:hypothetical protein